MALDEINSAFDRIGGGFEYPCRFFFVFFKECVAEFSLALSDYCREFLFRKLQEIVELYREFSDRFVLEGVKPVKAIDSGIRVKVWRFLDV